MSSLRKKINNRLVKILILTIYTSIICIISVMTTMLVLNHNISNNGAILEGGVSPCKIDKKYLNEKFDQFIAFGSESSKQMFNIDLLLKSNLIDDEAKSELIEFAKPYDSKSIYFNIYLGIKNGIDIVELHLLVSPYNLFAFKSNLAYSYESILNEFELMCGEKLSDDFLTGSTYDPSIGVETSGILINFNEGKDGLSSIYFKTTINGKVYVISQ